MSALLPDLRYAMRQLLRSPGFTAAAVLTLGLGIGAATAVFSVVDGVLFRALPYPDADRLVRVWHHNTRNDAPKETVSYETYRELVEGVDAVDAAAGISPLWSFTLRDPGEPERVEGYWVSASFFELLGVQPAHGRAFGRDEDRVGEPAVVVISHGLWQRRFGGGPDVIGRTVGLGSTPATVVGVAPPDFRFGEPADLWVPLAQNPIVGRGRQVRWVDVVARLSPGATVAGAQDQVRAFMERLEEAYPEANAGLRATVEGLHTAVVGDVRLALWTLLGGVGLVLFITCANVGTLLLARATARRSEMALRSALGAGGGRLARHVLTESVTLSLFGVLVGAMVAFGLLEILRAVGPADLPRLQEVVLDLRVLGVAAAAAFAAGVLLGLSPALAVARENLGGPLRQGGSAGDRKAGRVRGGLVVSQVALALVLLAGTGLLLQSFVQLTRVDPGFRAEGVLTLQLEVPEGFEGDRTVAFYEELFAELEALPGVLAAGGTTRIPLGDGLSTRLDIRGRTVADGDQPEVEFRRASGRYFEAMGIPLLRGRTFDERDRPDARRVMIVSRAAAEQLWPGEDPIGQEARFWFAGITPDAPWLEIVGMTGDVKHFGLDADAPPIVYVPFSQGPPGNPLIAVRTSGEPTALVGAVQDQIRALAPGIVIWDVRLMADRVAERMAGRRFALFLIGAFGAVALLLAAIGIYGVVAFGVRRRTREIGVRMALGAAQGEMVRMVVRHGLVLAVAGLALGLPAALLLMRVIEGLLFGVTPTDPVALAGVTALLAATAGLASWLPSRRAARIDPMEALRDE